MVLSSQVENLFRSVTNWEMEEGRSDGSHLNDEDAE